MRYLCIDFETNGFYVRGAEAKYKSLPFCSYPVQVGVHAVEDGVVSPLYRAVICGATSMNKRSQENIRLTLEDIANGIPFQQMITELAALMKPGDVMVAHKVDFDVGTCIGTTARRLDYESPELQRILTAPRFCTMLCAYCKSTFGKKPSMQQLCDHFEVELVNAHDAAGDSLALAKCVAEALRRGVMLCNPNSHSQLPNLRALHTEAGASRTVLPRCGVFPRV